MKIKTGKGFISLPVLLAIWSVSAIASLPGLAISPILGDLNRVFPKVTDLEIQMLTSLPSLLIIPFVLLSGKLSEGRGKLKILAAGLQQPVQHHTAFRKDREFCGAAAEICDKNTFFMDYINAEANRICQSSLHDSDRFCPCL